MTRKAFILIALAVLARPAPVFATQISFSSHTIDSDMNLDGPVQSALADFDRDGDLDIAVAEQYDAELSWIENVGGAFGSVRSISAAPLDLDVWGVAAGDLDGDGDVDVVGGTGYPFGAGAREVFWHENLGPGMDPVTDPVTWSTRNTLDSNAHGFGRLFVVDLDRDGDSDVVAALEGDEEIVWYENTDGAGSFAARANLAMRTGLRDAVLVDLDRDGNLDVVAAADDAGGDGVFFFENNASVPFAAGRRLLTLADVRALESADFTRDGWRDLLLITGDAVDAFYLAESEGPATMMGEPPVVFTLPSVISAIGGAGQAHSADVDGDGDIDVLVASLGDGVAGWLDNEGGSFTTRTLDDTLSNPMFVGGADLDRDGDFDPLVGDVGTDEFAWFENETPHGLPAFENLPIVISDIGAGDVNVLVTADFDGDADVDIAYGQSGVAGVRWLANDGDGAFAMPAVMTGTGAPDALLFDDLDRDGDIDLLYADDADASGPVWLENAGGSWTPHSVGAAILAERVIQLGDLDRDGDVDLVVATGSDELIWFENRLGDAVNDDFNPVARAIATGQTDPTTLAIVDLERDGDPDVVIGRAGEAPLRVFLNDGSGSFESGTDLPGSIADASHVVAADLDADGDPDLAAIDSGILRWWEHTDGAGAFADPAFLVGFVDASELSARDLDSDGDTDLIYLPASENAGWIQNQRDGDFQMNASLASGPDWPHPMGIADLDRDGLHDLVFVTDDNEIAWQANVGGTYRVSISPFLSSELDELQEHAVFSVDVWNNGSPGDSSIQIGALELRFEAASESPLTSAQANALIDGVRIRRDDGDSSFDPGADQLGYSLETLDLNDGVQPLTISSAAALEVAPGGSELFFVSVLLENIDYETDPSGFQVIYRPGATRVVVAGDGPEVSGRSGRMRTAGPFDVLPGDVEIFSFSNDSGVINFSQSATLSYEVSNTTGCDIANDLNASTLAIGAGDSVSGMQDVMPAADATYTLTCQGVGGPVSETVVVDVNQLPVAVSDAYEVGSGDILTVDAGEGLLTNDSDADGPATLSVSLYDMVSANGGSVSVQADGSFVYTPPADFIGSDSFAYRASDSLAATTGSVTVTVSAAGGTGGSATFIGGAGGGCTLSQGREPDFGWLLLFTLAGAALLCRGSHVKL